MWGRCGSTRTWGSSETNDYSGAPPTTPRRCMCTPSHQASLSVPVATRIAKLRYYLSGVDAYRLKLLLNPRAADAPAAVAGGAAEELSSQTLENKSK